MHSQFFSLHYFLWSLHAHKNTCTNHGLLLPSPPLSQHQCSSHQPQHGTAMTRMGGQVGCDCHDVITLPIIRVLCLLLGWQRQPNNNMAKQLQVAATMTLLQPLLSLKDIILIWQNILYQELDMSTQYNSLYHTI
jgi:hypothetical protein